jgi:hypothetical protein
LLIGGATTSRAHTALKIEPHYKSPTVWVKDASRAVGVAQSLISKELVDEFLAKIRAEYVEIRERHKDRGPAKRLVALEHARNQGFCGNWETYTPAVPNRPGITVLDDYPLGELIERIDWTPFFRAWELAGNYPAILEDKVVGESAKKLYADARKMLDHIVREKWLTAKGVVSFWPCRRDGDDVVLYADDSRTKEISRLYFLRQQVEKRAPRANMCLADFISPEADWIGGFAVTAGHGIEAHLARFAKDHDDYNDILLKSLADRLAEASAEALHLRVRRELWGYSPEERLTNEQLIAEGPLARRDPQCEPERPGGLQRAGRERALHHRRSVPAPAPRRARERVVREPEHRDAEHERQHDRRRVGGQQLVGRRVDQRQRHQRHGCRRHHGHAERERELLATVVLPDEPVLRQRHPERRRQDQSGHRGEGEREYRHRSKVSARAVVTCRAHDRTTRTCRRSKRRMRSGAPS